MALKIIAAKLHGATDPLQKCQRNQDQMEHLGIKQKTKHKKHITTLTYYFNVEE